MPDFSKMWKLNILLADLIVGGPNTRIQCVLLIASGLSRLPQSSMTHRSLTSIYVEYIFKIIASDLPSTSYQLNLISANPKTENKRGMH